MRPTSESESSPGGKTNSITAHTARGSQAGRGCMQVTQHTSRGKIATKGSPCQSLMTQTKRLQRQQKPKLPFLWNKQQGTSGASGCKGDLRGSSPDKGPGLLLGLPAERAGETEDSQRGQKGRGTCWQSERLLFPLS